MIPRKSLLTLTVLVGFVLALVFLFRSTPSSLSDWPTSSLPVVRLDCPPTAVLCGVFEEKVQDRLSLPLNALRAALHRLLTNVAFGAKLCPTVEHVGNVGNGGYDICMAPEFRPEKGNCLVYSFGISRDWSFDEDMSRGQFECEVHSFDPSIDKEDHTHSQNVYFHNVGLWGSNITNAKNWKLEKFSSIRGRLGHLERTIDVLKVDVEIAEWPFLRNVLYGEPEQLKTVRQIIFELHTPAYKTETFGKAEVIEVTEYLRQLTNSHGFVGYRNKQLFSCCDRFTGMMPSFAAEKCCHEMYYLNSNSQSLAT